MVGTDRLTGSMEMEDTSSNPVVAEARNRSRLSRLEKLSVRLASMRELEPYTVSRAVSPPSVSSVATAPTT